MGDGLFNKFKILIGVEDAEEEREVQTVSAAPVAAVCRRRGGAESTACLSGQKQHICSAENGS